MTQVRHRIFSEPQVRKVEEDNRVVEFVASDASVDSYNTVLNPEGWDLERFNKNGIVGYQHDVYYGSDPDNVIGKGEARAEDGLLIVRVTFEPADLNEKADKVYRKVLFGTLNGVSVGFQSRKGHWGDKKRSENPDVYYFDEQELLEVSVVNIPANPNAVKRSAEDEQEILPDKPAPEPDNQIENEEEARKAAELDINISLTTARAKALLALNHHNNEKF